MTRNILKAAAMAAVMAAGAACAPSADVQVSTDEPDRVYQPGGYVYAPGYIYRPGGYVYID